MSATAFNAMRRRRAAAEKAAREAREATEKAKTADKPLDKMTLAELDAKAAELGVVFPDDIKLKAARAAFLAEAIEASAKAIAEADAEAKANNDGETDKDEE